MALSFCTDSAVMSRINDAFSGPLKALIRLCTYQDVVEGPPSMS